jgi:hypothetical protein
MLPVGNCDNRLQQQQLVYSCNIQLAYTPTAKNNQNNLCRTNRLSPLDVLNSIPALLCIGVQHIRVCHQARVHALLIPVRSAIVYTMPTPRHVVGKCWSNMLHSLRAWGVVPKAVRTSVYDTAHVCNSRCAIQYITTESEVIYTHAYGACRHTKYKHACIPCTYTYLHSSALRFGGLPR